VSRRDTEVAAIAAAAGRFGGTLCDGFVPILHQAKT
jgi:hypothetical protein